MQFKKTECPAAFIIDITLTDFIVMSTCIKSTDEEYQPQILVPIVSIYIYMFSIQLMLNVFGKILSPYHHIKL